MVFLTWSMFKRVMSYLYQSVMFDEMPNVDPVLQVSSPFIIPDSSNKADANNWNMICFLKASSHVRSAEELDFLTWLFLTPGTHPMDVLVTATLVVCSAYVNDPVCFFSCVRTSIWHVKVMTLLWKKTYTPSWFSYFDLRRQWSNGRGWPWTERKISCRENMR